jgi:Na+-driven multidrug efflux pump
MPVTIIAGISLLVNVIVGCLLIRGYGLIGVAWSAAIVYWVRLMLTAVVYRKKTRISFLDIWLPVPADIAIYRNKLEKTLMLFFPGRSVRV